MIEVAPRLYVGSADDYESLVRGRDGWAVVHACKEPYHRRLLGYTGRSAPEGPERLVAVRGDELYLNLVDAPSVEYISAECVDYALAFIDARMAVFPPINLLVHCNKGESRGPSIVLLALAREELISRENAVADFTRLYPPYKPGAGMAVFVEQALRRD